MGFYIARSSPGDTYDRGYFAAEPLLRLALSTAQDDCDWFKEMPIFLPSFNAVCTSQTLRCSAVEEGLANRELREPQPVNTCCSTAQSVVARLWLM